MRPVCGHISQGAAANPRGSGNGEAECHRKCPFLSVRRREDVQILQPDLESLILKTNSKSTLLCKRTELSERSSVGGKSRLSRKEVVRQSLGGRYRQLWLFRGQRRWRPEPLLRTWHRPARHSLSSSQTALMVHSGKRQIPPMKHTAIDGRFSHIPAQHRCLEEPEIGTQHTICFLFSHFCF